MSDRIPKVKGHSVQTPSENPSAATQPVASDSLLNPMDILTPAEVADLFHLPTSWVYEATRQRNGTRNPDPLPFRKVGRYLRFSRQDILEWWERQKHNRSGK